jgi:hypothetical protein
LDFDIPNWVTMVVEILTGIGLGIFFFLLQKRAQQKNKVYQCQRIIYQLQNIENAEQDMKTYLTSYELGDPTLKIFAGSFSSNTNNSVQKMEDAMGQLQSGLIDNSLREQFLAYLGWFNALPKRILINNQPQQEHERKDLLDIIDKQMEKIQHFIERFRKEL